MKKEKRSFLNKIFKIRDSVSTNTSLKIVDGFRAFFSSVSSDITLNDSVVICIDTIAKQCAKFEPRHYKNINGQKIFINGDINYLLSNQQYSLLFAVCCLRISGLLHQFRKIYNMRAARQ